MRAGHQHPDWLCAGTELGKISRLVDQAGQSATPLEEKLNRLSTILIGVTLGLSVLFVVVGLIRDESAGLLIETSLALAIAAIPEGMSVVATIALGALAKLLGTNTGNLITKSEVPVLATPKNYKTADITSVLYATDYGHALCRQRHSQSATFVREGVIRSAYCG